MRPPWRSLLVLPLVACLGVLAAVAAEDEWEKPFAGLLPEPDSSVSVNPMEAAAEMRPRIAGTRILDAATGRPVPDATLALFPEDESELVTSYATRKGHAAADSQGYAAIEIERSPGDGHWVAEAPGHAPAYRYAAVPPAFMALTRAVRDVEARLLDAMGRPIADAPVDAYPGCSHSGTIRSARTAKDGRFTLAAMRGGDFAICATTPAGAASRVDGVGTLGRRTCDVVLATPRRVSGRILDARGKPLAGVVVRGTEYRRAPIAVSDADGRFELTGLPRLGQPLFHVPGGPRAMNAGDAGPLPLLIRLDEDGFVVEPGQDATAELRVVTADGPVAGASVRFTRVGDGWTSAGITGEDGETHGLVTMDLPPGTYDVAPEDPFQPAAFAPFRWDVKGSVSREVTGTLQPTLVIEGDVPGDAGIVLATADGEIACGSTAAEWRPHLPRDATAVVRITPLPNQLATSFFAVEATAGGTRRVKAALAEPSRISVRGPEGVLLDAPVCDGAKVAVAFDEGSVLTYAEGPMRVIARTDTETRAFHVDLPAKDGAPVVLEFAAGELVAGGEDGRVTYALADGSVPKDVTYLRATATGSSSGPAPSPVETYPPCRVVLRLTGHQTFDRWFAAVEDVRFTWGTASLRLTVRDAAGAPAPSVVLVDDVLHWTNEAVLELAGLAAGPHRVVVQPVDRTLGARELQIVLRDGEKRERAVVAPKR